MKKCTLVLSLLACITVLSTHGSKLKACPACDQARAAQLMHDQQADLLVVPTAP